MNQTAIRINLMPHREVKREANKQEFIRKLVLSAILACCLVFMVGTLIDKELDAQTQKNEFIKAEIGKLDVQIKEIATLQQEIDALVARQKAVEDLQSDRNLPIYLFDEMVRYTPEGVHLKGLKQDGLKVVLVGVAQTQERVSEMIRNFSNASLWVESPELIEIKSIQGAKANEKLYEFNMMVMLKRQSKASVPSTQAKTPVVLPPPR